MSGLHEWPDKVKTMQKNWIGKSVGVEINFEILNENLGDREIKIFTTRPDTLYGATFIAISPDHKLSKKLLNTNKNVNKFINPIKMPFTFRMYPTLHDY